MALMTFIEAIRDTLAEEMRRDESVIVLGEDVGKKGGVFLATDGLWAEFGDDRVIDTPLTESMIVGASIGAAVNGLRPVAEIQFADFIHPAFNQIVSEAARMRYRSNNAVGVPMTIRAPYGGGVHGALYHSQSVEAFFTHVPGLKVVVPSTPHDARGLLRSSIRDDDPVLFFEHKKMYRSVRGDVPDGDFVVPLGRARVTHPGSQVTVIAYGLMAHYALEAADRVAEEGISVEVVDLRTLRPLDKDTVLDLGPQDRQVPRRVRGQPVRRLRRRGRGDRRRGGVRLPRRTGHPDRRPRRPGRPVQPRPRGLVHGRPGEDPGRASASSPPTERRRRLGHRSLAPGVSLGGRIPSNRSRTYAVDSSGVIASPALEGCLEPLGIEFGGQASERVALFDDPAETSRWSDAEPLGLALIGAHDDGAGFQPDQLDGHHRGDRQGDGHPRDVRDLSGDAQGRDEPAGRRVAVPGVEARRGQAARRERRIVEVVGLARGFERLGPASRSASPRRPAAASAAPRTHMSRARLPASPRRS